VSPICSCLFVLVIRLKKPVSPLINIIQHCLVYSDFLCDSPQQFICAVLVLEQLIYRQDITYEQYAKKKDQYQKDPGF